MIYSFKALQEFGWAVVVAIVTYAAPVIAGANPGDWKTWLPALAAGCARAALAAIVAKLGSGSFQAS